MSSASGQGSVSVTSGITLKIDPGRPIAGRDISFSIEGLNAWQRFAVRFIDPLGNAAEWITEDEATYLRVAGNPTVEKVLYADGDGRAQWVRIGTQDSEGVWTLNLKMEPAGEYRVTYTIAQTQLETTKVKRLEMDFQTYKGTITTSYFSALVPFSMALDLQPYLAAVTDKLRTSLGLQSHQIPDLYLLGNQALFEAAQRALGLTPGWEAGFYRIGEPSPGIYMKANYLKTTVRQTLTHEYVHLVLDEASPSVSLPAWVNEGAATYYELTLGLEFERPDISRRAIFQKAELVRTAALNNTLFPLGALESQRDWNAQKDLAKVQLQYAQAYMAVRYFIERFGEKRLLDLMTQLNKGSSLSVAFQAAAGISYEQFQTDFVAWAKTWQDPQREAVRAYAKEVRKIMDEWDVLNANRAKELGASGSLTSKWQGFVDTAKSLRQRGAALTSPAGLEEFQAYSQTFLSRGVDWLQLELDNERTGDDSKRVQANNMIPEINARQNTTLTRLADVEYDFQLR